MEMINVSDLESKGLLLTSFDSGSKPLNRFFHRYALINNENKYGVTYVLVEEREIIGFFTLAMSSTTWEESGIAKPSDIPNVKIPSCLIGRLAISKDRQNQGFGTLLLGKALSIASKISNEIGCYMVLVDAKEEATCFYEKNGYKPFPKDPERLYKRTENIEA